MRDAARALDDVSDHLGEVLRHADRLLAEWSGFGAQVRAQVERDVSAIGSVVDGAVARAAGAGLDRAVTDRLRALTGELERLEQRTRAASRAVVEQRAADRRVLWIAVAGIVLANALLVVLVLRRPAAAVVAAPIRIESAPAAAVQSVAPVEIAAPAAGSAAVTAAGSASDAAATPPVPDAGSGAASAGSNAGSATTGSAASSPTGARAGANAATAVKPAPPRATKPNEAGAATKASSSPISLPPKAGYQRPHKKQP